MESFPAYPKTKRLESETITISEKIDGTNGLIRVRTHLDGTKDILAGSRSKWLFTDGTKTWDNHGFGQWVRDNELELSKLPDGDHYGEWYGRGINRNYGMKDRKFMLFNRERYVNLEEIPNCVELETVLFNNASIYGIDVVINGLEIEMDEKGSTHVPGFDRPEGLILRFKLAGKVYKEIFSKD